MRRTSVMILPVLLLGLQLTVTDVLPDGPAEIRRGAGQKMENDDMIADSLSGQEHPFQTTDYQYPQDPLVLEKLEHWRNLKFGLMMTWGLYAQLGIVESWGLCSEDQSFQDRGGMPYTEYKEMYFNLIEKFNPQKFDPHPWAQAALDAGMKYLIFTTKHHDGFNMFDTQQTDFKVTGRRCPFAGDPRANITREVFDAFRRKGFMIGVYFSKPDWHHPAYWTPLLATPNRCNNYDTRKYPERWQEFCDFTYRQIEELVTGYGSIDILWLDGGWVRPSSTITDEVRSWGYDIPDWEQDIDMPRIIKMARGHQPGLIAVDRTVHGPFENYRTPEQQVPEEVLPFPWETCMTMTQSWGHHFEPVYKSAGQLIHTLVDIVAKGGNFLLNIGPTPQGLWEKEAYLRLKQIGQWMNVNGEAIYGSQPFAPHKQDKICFTQNKDSKAVYAIYLSAEGEKRPPQKIRLRTISFTADTRISMLGRIGSLEWKREGEGYVIELPISFRENPPCEHAWTLKIAGN
jgi:alpha-L-fucosidase